LPAYKYTLKDGKTTKWYANFYYTDWTGEKKHACKRGFSTQRDAKEYERNFLDQLHRNTDILFTSLVENYMKDMGHRLKATTIANKEHIIETKITPYFEKLRVCDIDTLAIRNWQNELLSYRDENDKPYSQTYIKTIHNQMSAIMNYASKHYGLLVNPCKAAGSVGKSRASEMKIWTRDEFTEALKYEKKSGYHLAFNILFYSGIREGELLALTPADILPSKQLDIHKTFAVVKGKQIIQEAKTEKSKRIVALPEFVYNEIIEYIGKICGIKKNERLFMFTKSSLGNEIKKLAKKADLEEIRVHDLRHSHASMLIDMKVDILEISRRLGHESVKTTWDTYGHLYPNKDANLASQLNDLWENDVNTPPATSS
jgi:integrase